MMPSSPQTPARPDSAGNGLRALEFGLAPQHTLHRAGRKVAQSAGAGRAWIHHGRLHHEQAREARGGELRGEHQVGSAGAVSNAVDVGKAECFDRGANVLGEILEVVTIGRRLVTVAMAAAVERIDGVVGGEFARHVVPDLGDEAGAVHQERRWLA
jgi:hypothetical protein